jgi:hypothetical protein
MQSGNGELQLDKSELLNLLKIFDEEASKQICLVAVGGTAMTLLNLKLSTKDIDFTVPGADKPEFDRVRKTIPHGYTIDVWADGTIFCVTLPSDYLQRSSDVVSFEKIHLKALHPVDIVVTKAARLENHDVADIKECIKKFGVRREDVQKRAQEIVYVGKEEDYWYNVRWVLDNLF